MVMVMTMMVKVDSINNPLLYRNYKLWQFSHARLYFCIFIFSDLHPPSVHPTIHPSIHPSPFSSAIVKVSTENKLTEKKLIIYMIRIYRLSFKISVTFSDLIIKNIIYCKLNLCLDVQHIRVLYIYLYRLYVCLNSWYAVVSCVL